MQVEEEGPLGVPLVQPVGGPPADLARITGAVAVDVEALLEAHALTQLRVAHEGSRLIPGLSEGIRQGHGLFREDIGEGARLVARAPAIHAVLQG